MFNKNNTLMHLVNNINLADEPLNEIEQTNISSILKKQIASDNAQKQLKFWAGKPLRMLLIAAVIFTVFSVTVAALGLENILQMFNIGNGNIVIQNKEQDVIDVPPEWIGKVFDKDGNALTKINKTDELFTSDGQRIVSFVDNNPVTSLTEEPKADKTTFKDIEQACKHLSITPLLPSWLPDGYTFNRVELYGSGEEISGDYADIYYANKSGEEINISQRLDSPELATKSSTDQQIKKVTINGQAAVLTGSKSTSYHLEWAQQNKYIYIFSKKLLSEKEIIKLAESMK